MEQENTPKRKAAWPIFILPVIFILIGIGFSITPIKLLFTGEKITGTVVDVRSRQSKDDDGNIQTLYSPVIRYTCGGKQVTESPDYYSSKRYTRNESITILCNESKPTEFTTYGGFFPLMFTLFGLIFLFIQIYNIKNAKIDGISKSDLEKIYNAYGFVYDENQSQQKDLLNFLGGEIFKINYEIQNSSFFKGLKLKRDLDKLIKKKQAIEAGYTSILGSKLK